MACACGPFDWGRNRSATAPIAAGTGPVCTRKIGVSDEDAEAIESGTHEIAVPLLFRIASVLKTSMSRILRRAEQRAQRLFSKEGRISRSPKIKRARGR